MISSSCVTLGLRRNGCNPTYKLRVGLLVMSVRIPVAHSGRNNASAILAPEILTKDTHDKYDQSVDMWSVGVILYIL